MKPSVALTTHRAHILALTAAHRLGNPRIFGSVLRGEDREGSDLDLLVDAPAGTTLFDLGALQSDLEDLLGIRIDVLTAGDLPARFRDRVLAEAHPV
ncbi:nucleotidyltransferase family protein [Nguyenibacter vanlangensis]|uniref:Nucleotidyltransferase family protein n=1 Tax=Nguyenibacter vanlangensis TaxID=1216886 RepID=A0ABZ3DB72_9PROT